MEYALKKNPSPGICPVRGCRRRKGNKKRLCERHAARWWRFHNPLRAAYIQLKHHAKTRRKLFSITFEEFREFIEPTRYLDDRGNARFCLHIDRIREEDGYVSGNLQVLTCSENVAKENRRRFVAYFNRPVPDPDNCPF